MTFMTIKNLNSGARINIALTVITLQRTITGYPSYPFIFFGKFAVRCLNYLDIHSRACKDLPPPPHPNWMQYNYGALQPIKTKRWDKELKYDNRIWKVLTITLLHLPAAESFLRLTLQLENGSCFRFTSEQGSLADVPMHSNRKKVFAWFGRRKFLVTFFVKNRENQADDFMYLLTKWEGRMGKHLARGHDVGTERSEVRAPWPRAKYFPIRPDLT